MMQIILVSCPIDGSCLNDFHVSWDIMVSGAQLLMVTFSSMTSVGNVLRHILVFFLDWELFLQSCSSSCL